MHTLHINRPPSPEPIRTIPHPHNRHQQQNHSFIDRNSRINQITRQCSGVPSSSSEYSAGSSTSSLHSLRAIRIASHPPILQLAVLHTPVIMPHIQHCMRTPAPPLPRSGITPRRYPQKTCHRRHHRHRCRRRRRR